MQHMIAGCESCSEDEELPIENILDRLTGSDPSVTDYVLEVPAKCFQCGAEIAAPIPAPFPPPAKAPIAAPPAAPTPTRLTVFM
jgi:hypothetical protein